MAAGLTRTFSAAAAASMLIAHVSAADVLVDPTRPPAGFAAQTTEAPRRPVLQSIIITPHSRVAIIDDERVELNGRFRDAQVARITETEVVLRSPSGVETLRIYPGVDKTPVRREPPKTAAERPLRGDKR